MSKNNGLDIDKTKESALSTAIPPATDVAKTPAQAATPVPEIPAEPEKDGKAFVSVGKKLHNEITYRGIDWLVNSAVGITFAYWSSRTKSGQKYFSEPVAGFFKKILKPVLKSEQSLEEGAKWGTMFASIMAGGTTIIPVMMTLEDKKNKKGIIKWIDEKWYGKDIVANDPKFEESYKAIDEEPHKSFGIGMASRFAALAPLIALSVYAPTNKVLIKNVYDPIGNVSKWTSRKIGIKPSKDMLDPLKGALEHIEGDPNIPKRMMSNWDFLHRTIGFDLGLTFIYSFLHEMAYKGFAKLGMKETDTDKLKGQQFSSQGEFIAPPSSVATEVDLIEHSSHASKTTPLESKTFASKIKPKTNKLSEPSELHTKKLATQDLKDDTRLSV